MHVINKIIVAITIFAISLCCGCGVFGLFGTPARREKKVPAEFDLKAQSEKKLLVLVNQPAWLVTSADMNRRLTTAIHEKLMDKHTTGYRNLILYEQVADYLSRQPDNYVLSPEQVGRQLGAQLVLYVVLDKYELSQVSESDYYNGLLAGRVQLVDVRMDEILWPDSANGKSIRIEFEVEKGGYETAVVRLNNSFAHCTVRYFYDCPVPQFKIFDDKSHAGWQQWGD